MFWPELLFEDNLLPSALYLFAFILQTSLCSSLRLCGFVGGIIVIGVVGGLLLVLGGWLFLLFFSFLFLFVAF